MLANEAQRGIGTWTSPSTIARLLLMRRIPRPIPCEHDLRRFRMLRAIIPDTLHLSPVLLAGVA
ncbi:MAG: hypothetical protein E5Y34_06860, partial [Mesorhizobium sp.]